MDFIYLVARFGELLISRYLDSLFSHQKKMASLGTIHYLTVTMKKHPLSMKLEPPLSEKVQQYIDSSEENEVVIYEGLQFKFPSNFCRRCKDSLPFST